VHHVGAVQIVVVLDCREPSVPILHSAEEVDQLCSIEVERLDQVPFAQDAEAQDSKRRASVQFGQPKDVQVPLVHPREKTVDLSQIGGDRLAIGCFSH
jgi:hypothetical protein